MKKALIGLVIIGIIAIVVCAFASETVFADPNTPLDPNVPFDPNAPEYSVGSLRALTETEKQALRINNVTLQQIVNEALRREVTRAIRKRVNNLTFAEIEAILK